MLKSIIVTTTILSALIIITSQDALHAEESPKPWLAPIEDLAKLPEEEIDIGNVALLLAKEAFPDLDVKKYSDQIDQMVKDIRKLNSGSTDPDFRIRSINTYFYLDKGIHYDKDDQYGRELKNRFLNGILDTKSGSCATMPLLYLAVAQRLGYPIYPVAAPQHLFLRYVTPKMEMPNIEAVGGGGYSSDEHYIHVMEIPEKGIQHGAYLETMTYKQMLGDLITENGFYWAHQDDYMRAIKYLEIGTKLNTKAAEAYRFLGNVYYNIAADYRTQSTYLYDTGDPHVDKTLKITRNLYEQYCRNFMNKGDIAISRAHYLGVAPPLKQNYWIRQEKRALELKKL
ncbi:MAG: hypothetical protein COV74_00355 [Candidatus Omnitrophica bacterium CG11_big_fil_rev_8_21_14_0_20_45_26]|uniref:Protein SirB1 N-terminal domain-containing protein n=1 Tax=Candidatus Abzuiibacterium crystallinum TaxID=1974748 RepID=A0A2H0LT27_9BACT|nr:MAG: hypothetical protein COV74_00355 [Candidatus Omnitrophica bacterium CG11_big_fil_rev_8_21_14_0_20_45_26]PIW64610.1 MAG: hypothetical protein COW12_05425 [Candidatus Omnitrophica bacterium CG12_big_fil_rev_8_21_14_0_65_45_16]